MKYVEHGGYAEFLQLVVYGVRPDFDEAMVTIASLVGRL
jgi:hypothetical protein